MVSYLGLLPLAALIYALAHTGKAHVRHAGRRGGSVLRHVLASCSVSRWSRWRFSAFVPLTIGGLLDDKLKNALGDRSYDIARASFRVIALLARRARGGRSRSGARRGGVARASGASGACSLRPMCFVSLRGERLGAWAIRGAAGILLVMVVAWVTLAHRRRDRREVCHGARCFTRRWRFRSGAASRKLARSLAVTRFVSR